MKLLLSTNVKDEHNILEWIDFHCKLGFTHLLIWDDMSDIPVSTLLSSHLDKDKDCMVVVEVRREHALKQDYMEQSVAYAKEHGLDFMLHLDGDEYLYLGWKSQTEPLRIHEYLESVVDSPIMAIYLPWLMMGSNGHVRSPPPGSCLQHYTRSDSKVHFFIKQLARVSAISGVRHAHEYIYSLPLSPETCVSSAKQPLTRFSMNQPSLIPVSKHMPPCIAHFRNQSWDHFRHRRSAHRIRDDTGQPWKYSRGQLSTDSPIPPPGFLQEATQADFPYVLQIYSAMSVFSHI